MKDLTKITTPFGLLKPKTKSRLKKHFNRGGVIEFYTRSGWRVAIPSWSNTRTYRAKPIPKPAPTPDTVDWSAIKHGWDYVARDKNGKVWAYDDKPRINSCGAYWIGGRSASVQTNWLNIHTTGTCDWKDSLIERPKTGEAE